MTAADEGEEVLDGEGIVNLDWAGTGAFVATATAGAIAPDPFRAPAVVVSVALFAIGIAAFLWAYGVAVSRSRYEQVSIGGVYFLATAPKVVRVRVGLAFAVQLVAAITTAALRPFTTQAFAALAPMFGLGLAGLWGARYGTFPEREPRKK